MKNKFWLFILLLVLFSSLISAGSFNHYVEGDDTLTANKIFHLNSSAVESLGGTSGEVKNGGLFQTKDWTNGTGLTLDGTNDAFDTNAWGTGEADPVTACQGFAISFWVETQDTTSLAVFLSSRDTGADETSIFMRDVAGDMDIEVGVNTGNIQDKLRFTNGRTALSDGIPHHVVVMDEGGDCEIVDSLRYYIDGVNQTSFSVIQDNTVVDNAFVNNLTFGHDPDLAGTPLNATFEEIILFNRALTNGEIQTLNATNYSEGGGTPEVSDTFKITASDNYTGVSLNNLSAEILNLGNFSTINGTLYSSLLQNSTSLWNITISSNDSGNYHSKTYLNYNVSSNLNATLEPFFDFFNVTYSNYYEYSSLNYTRNLTFTGSLSCSNGLGNVSLFLLSNNTKQKTLTLSCTNNTIETFTSSFKSSSEGHLSYSLLLNTSYKTEYNNEYSVNYTFVSDLYAPNITLLNFTIPNGFFNNSVSNVTMLCNDSVAPILLYNLTFENETSKTLGYGNKTTGSLLWNNTNLSNGVLTVTGRCSDFFSTTNQTEQRTVYQKNLILINERLNTLFDVSNLSSVKAYFDDNSSFYDFKQFNSSQIEFVSSTTDKLRIQLTYPSGVVTRYVDVGLSGADLRVCANTDDVTHYEQIVISATQKAVSLENVFSNCVIAQDYTRFAYQDALMLKAFTIDSLYSLSTYSNGQEVILASMDGSIATFYNVDVLQFNAQAFDVNIQGDGLSFKKSDNNTIEIYFQNTFNDSVSTAVKIKRLNTSATVFSDTEITNPNSFYMYFDFSTLNIGENEIFEIEVTLTLDDGSTRIVKRYFNTQGSVGWLKTEVAFVLAVVITIFGLTFLVVAQTLGWFGLVVQVMSIAILSFGTQTWYSLILMGCNVIILIYILLMSIVAKDRGAAIT